MNAKQSCESPMPMIFGCDKVFILSSCWSAVLAGRNQLFKTMKREAVLVCQVAWSGHDTDAPCTAPSLPCVKVGDRSAISWLRYRRWTDHSG